MNIYDLKRKIQSLKSQKNDLLEQIESLNFDLDCIYYNLAKAEALLLEAEAIEAEKAEAPKPRKRTKIKL